jgi:uncharacterized protein
MQKVTLCFLIVSLLIFTGCAEPEAPAEATPESAQRYLKLRGYDFDENSYFAAGQARDLMALKMFVEAGINRNAQDADGRTVLISAAARGDLEVVNALFTHKVDLNVKDKRGYTALSHAIDAMYEEVVAALLSRPDLDPNVRGLNGRPALSAYVWREDKGKVERLLALGADVNAKDNDSDTALHGAAQSGNVEIMQLLLDKGADVNAKNSVGGTPLMWTAVHGHENAARLLLSRGADASLKDEDGVTAAQWATRNNKTNVAALLRGR